MADLNIIRSLASIDTGHAVFEPDQVLTHQQLNSVTNYLSDQQRLTRVELLGVGIVGGLRVAQVGNKVTVTKGVGVTTDGDLLMLASDSIFDRWKPYDQSAPKYAPLYNGNTMRPAYELIGEGESDTLARPLTQLPSPGLSQMVAVLLMESYEADQDLCSGTDCDNLGRDAVNTMRLLLVPRGEISALATAITSLTQNASQLPVLLADRPAITGSLTTAAQLATLYRNACNNIHTSVIGALDELHKHVPALSLDLFGSDPSPAWIATLNNIKASFATNGNGIQYYYDFLKDVVETWNALRDVLLDNDCVLCPDLAAFPKHLLLGDLANPSQSRTGFYPSPMVGSGRKDLEHAAFLAWKLHVLINTFALPASSPAPGIAITPSRTETVSLEERAIPYYYSANNQLPILHAWNWRRAKRGTSSGITGYRAAAMGASAAAQAPLNGQIGQYDFFRIEGHIGQDVDAVMDKLEADIGAKNLPFCVRAVLLHTGRGPIKRKPPIRYNDLHRLHKLIRADMDTELVRAKDFSGKYLQRINEAATAKHIPNDSAKMSRANNYHTTITNTVAEGRKAFSKTRYSEFKAEKTWSGQHDAMVQAASNFKHEFGDVSRTDFVTDFDNAMLGNRKNWLDWLDILIDHKDQQADERLLFFKFLKDNPGLEHFGGVTRGGTFVVVYDSNARVVADFMLPYRSVEEVEDEPEEPPLTYRPLPLIMDSFVMIKPLVYQFEDLKAGIREEWVREINVQTGYIKFFKENIDIFKDIKVGTQGLATNVDNLVASIDDRVANLYAENIASASKRHEKVKQIIQDPSTPLDVRNKLQQEMDSIELEIAQSVTIATQYMAEANLGMDKGGAGEKTLQVVAQGVGLVTNQAAKQTMTAGLKQIQATAPAPHQAAIGAMAQSFNIRL